VDGGADSMTVWVDKSTRKVVKMEAIMVKWGGASDHGTYTSRYRFARIVTSPLSDQSRPPRRYPCRNVRSDAGRHTFGSPSA